MIVVGIDGAVPGRAAVEWAAGDAFRMHVPLRVVHVVDRASYQIPEFPIPDRSESLRRMGQKVLNEALVRERLPIFGVTTRLVEGSPARVLCEQAKTAEVVVDSRGLGRFAGAGLDSLSYHVVGHAGGPVVVGRPRSCRSSASCLFSPCHGRVA